MQKDLKAYLVQRDDGAFGYSGTLNICDTKDSLKETIGLRVEDVSPKIDSIIGKDVYIHYNYPGNSKNAQIEKLELPQLLKYVTVDSNVQF